MYDNNAIDCEGVAVLVEVDGWERGRTCVDSEDGCRCSTKTSFPYILFRLSGQENAKTGRIHHRINSTYDVGQQHALKPESIRVRSQSFGTETLTDLNEQCTIVRCCLEWRHSVSQGSL